MDNKEAQLLMVHYIISQYFAKDTKYADWLKELWWWKYRENLNLVHEPIINVCNWLKTNLVHLRISYAGYRFTDKELIEALNRIISKL